MYTFYKKNKLIIFIVILALFVRLYQLGTLPAGFHADEVRAGWNAYSILKTGKDDRGNRLAFFYNTFGDYRPTGIFYATIPSIVLFGNTEFAVRFPSAFLGGLSVIPLYLLVSSLLKGTQVIKKEHVALISAGILAFSPWHINVSRATSEVVISLFFALWGFYFYLRLLHDFKTKYALYSFSFFTTSYFFYHSIRLLAPIFVFVIFLSFWKKLKEQPRKIAFGVVLALFVLTAIWSIPSQARGRFSQVSIFNDLDVQYELSRMPFEEGPNQVFIARLFHNKPLVYTRHFLNEYAKYFSANFLLGNAAKPMRYTTTGVGLLTYVEFILVILGTVAIAQKRMLALPLLLLLISPLAAALTTEDTPNLHRALFMILFISIIGGYGGYLLLTINRFKKIIIYGTSLLFFLNFIFFSHMYIVHTKVHAPLYRNIGAKELAIELAKLQSQYDKIILTNIPDDPYPWIAFFTNRDPAVFNKDAILREHGNWSTENFYFTGLRCPSRDAFKAPDVKRLLVVDTEGCESESNLRGRTDVVILKQIERPDYSKVYTLWSKVD